MEIQNIKKNGWLNTDKQKKIFKFAEGYTDFLSNNKTEMNVVDYFVKKADIFAFKEIDSYENLKSGDKVFMKNKDKGVIFAVLGKDALTSGMNLICSHIDSPRLDLKAVPLEEDHEIAFLKTHYYGGIKNYHWVNTPLAIHGNISLKSGKKLKIEIGEKESDPVFIIADILPHLAKKVQSEKKADELISGEELKLIIGSIPVENDEIKEKVKYKAIEILNRKFGIIEEDLSFAELELVPAGKARSVGLDEGLIGGYGQDDRICAYTSFNALMDTIEPHRTVLCYMSDREEVGCTGTTGCDSEFLDYFTGKLISKTHGQFGLNDLREIFWNSIGISADVTAGLNPVFKDIHDVQNAAKLNYGIAISKTGAGKNNASEASLELIAELRSAFIDGGILYQRAELGKLDSGGGGTVAVHLARRGIQIVDAGPPIVSMHSPFELSSKFDVFECYRAYKVFYGINKSLMQEIDFMKKVKIFDIISINIAVLVGIQWFSTSAKYGLGSILLWILAACLFFIPMSFICAELASIFYDKQGGMFRWINEILGERTAFYSSWLYYVSFYFFYPSVLTFSAIAFSYAFCPSLIHSKVYTTIYTISAYWLTTLISLKGLNYVSKLAPLAAFFGKILPLLTLAVIGVLSIFLFSDSIPVDFSFNSCIPHLNSENMMFVATLILAFAGIELSSPIAIEMERPTKDYPKAILLSALCVTTIYILGAITLTLVLSSAQIGAADGVLAVINIVTARIHLPFIGRIICFGISAGCIIVCSIILLSTLKMFVEGNGKKVLSERLRKENKNGVPVFLVIMQGIITTLIAFLSSILNSVELIYSTLVLMTAILLFIPYAILIIAYIKKKFSKNYNRKKAKIAVPGGKPGAAVMTLSALFSVTVTILIPVLSKPSGGSLFVYRLAVIGGPIIVFLIGVICYRRRRIT